MVSPETLCVIPARGGSRGITRKNLRHVGGRPLVAHVVEQALASERVGRVVVSTDDAEIADVARRCGAETLERPAELSGDTASSESAVLHVMDRLEEAESYRPELVAFLQCTSPLTTAADIDGTIAALLLDDADSALAVTPVHHFMWRRGADGAAEAINHDPGVRLRRQDRDPEFVEAGAVYVMRVAGFREARHRFFGRTVLYEIPRERHLEIDEPADLVRADDALRRRFRDQRVALLPERPAAVVLDFDGVLTDNTVLVSEDGSEAVRCHRGDGMGVARMRARGIPVLVLSTETNPVVAARCRKLAVPCVQGLDDKGAALDAWLDEHAIDPGQVVFLGNDVNDRPCLERVGCPVVVADAHPDVRRYARFELSTVGGAGAVRELTDMIEARLDALQVDDDA